MNKENLMKGLTIASGPIGWTITGLLYAEKFRQQYCEIRRRRKTELKPQLMSVMKIQDGDETFFLKIPSQKRKHYETALDCIQFRLKAYRTVYSQRKTESVILRYTAIDLVTTPFRHTDYREQKNITLNICGEQLGISVKRSHATMYKNQAKRLTKRYYYLRERYGEDVNDKQLMFLVMMDSDVYIIGT